MTQHSPQDRDFGDSAGYGGGGSTLDREEVGDTGGKTKRPNPLDAVMTPATDEGEPEERGPA